MERPSQAHASKPHIHNQKCLEITTPHPKLRKQNFCTVHARFRQLPHTAAILIPVCTHGLHCRPLTSFFFLPHSNATLDGAGHTCGQMTPRPPAGVPPDDGQLASDSPTSSLVLTPESRSAPTSRMLHISLLSQHPRDSDTPTFALSRFSLWGRLCASVRREVGPACADIWQSAWSTCANVWQMCSAIFSPLCIFEHLTGIKTPQDWPDIGMCRHLAGWLCVCRRLAGRCVGMYQRVVCRTLRYSLPLAVTVVYLLRILSHAVPPGVVSHLLLALGARYHSTAIHGAYDVHRILNWLEGRTLVDVVCYCHPDHMPHLLCYAP